MVKGKPNNFHSLLYSCVQISSKNNNDNYQVQLVDYANDFPFACCVFTVYNYWFYHSFYNDMIKGLLGLLSSLANVSFASSAVSLFFH